MNIINKLTNVALGFLFLVFSSNAFSAGLMTPINSQLAQLEIKQHHVSVVVEDGYAITHIDQTFHNPHSMDLEAIYSFPIPVKAAVGEFTYWIDGKSVTGEVLEKQAARDLYEKEKQAGRETALTEQDSYKTFDTSIYPVRANQDVKIRLVYIQPTHVDTGIGQYTYPLEEGGVDEEKLAFWTYNDEVSESFSFNMIIRSSYPIDNVRLPKHPQAVVQSNSKEEWNVYLINKTAINANDDELESNRVITPPTEPSVAYRLDQDIVVYWRHKEGLPGSVDMVAYKEDANSRGTFMMTVTPGEDLPAISQGRDWIFVLDLSGSMQGKFNSLVEGVTKGLTKLHTNDRFRIILFNNSAREVTNGFVTVSPENISHYSTLLTNTQPDGSTNLYAGLDLGFNKLDSDRPSAVMLVTDGVANVGITEKKAFLKLVEKYDVRLFTFVMGNSANRPMLESMTKVSNGFAMNISNSDDIVGKLLLVQSKLNHEALRDIDIKISGVNVKDMTPDHVGSLYRGQQLIVFGHYWDGGTAKITINGKITDQDKTYTTQFDFPDQATLHPEIERLWAYATIENLQDQMDYLGENADSKQAIIDVALEHSLVTDYTSLIVVRDEVFQSENIQRNNANRVSREEQARAQRNTSPVRNNRQDTSQPMYSKPRPSFGGSSGGGGAAGPWILLVLIISAAARRYTK
ncbi:MAG: VIT and vWA domain-containing protein [Gammaproteobacteria bacterium]